MAAAYVSGAVALMLERDGKLDWSKARAILSSTARKPSGSLGVERSVPGFLTRQARSPSPVKASQSSLASGGLTTHPGQRTGALRRKGRRALRGCSAFFHC